MLGARSLQLYFTLVVLSATSVLAQGGNSTGDGCDWSCSVDKKIDTLTQEIDKILKYLFPNEDNTNITTTESVPSSESAAPSPMLYASTFGTPYVSTASFQDQAYTVATPTSSNAIVTVAPTGSSTSPIATSSAPSEAAADVETRSGYRAVAYYGNWDIYARKYFPQQVPASKLTHLLYSFADNKPDGTVYLTDTYADTDIHYAGDSWSDSGNNVYGNMKQLQLLKQQNRNLKVLLSIGGWTYTNTKKDLDTPASTAEGRQTFAASCVDMIKNYGFDGIDIDWEYPQDTTQGGQFLALLTEIRKELDAYAETLVYRDDSGNEEKPHFLMSIAAPAGEINYRNLPLEEISDVLDFVNLMAYDYSGSWNNVTGHAANLYASISNPGSTSYNTYSVVNAYLAAGVPSDKLNLGMPLYGRAFTKTQGLGKPYDGIGAGTWEAGVYDFKDLPLKGATEYYNKEAGATYSYDSSIGMLVSYDTVSMAMRKVDYIKQNKLGGAMWWEVSGDRTDDKSIISNVVKGLGGSDGSGIESASNWLEYPDSEFDNIKNMSSG